MRPYCIEFLREMGKIFEIVVFTASRQDYADAVIDKLDPDGSLIDHRLYRQHCLSVYGNFKYNLSRFLYQGFESFGEQKTRGYDYN